MRFLDWRDVSAFEPLTIFTGISAKISGLRRENRSHQNFSQGFRQKSAKSAWVNRSWSLYSQTMNPAAGFLPGSVTVARVTLTHLV